MKYIRLLQTVFILILSFSLQGQSIEVSGVVTSLVDTESIIGATVTIKDMPGSGTITDEAGQYSISVPSTESILVFSYLGMATIEEVVGNRKTIDIVMEPESSALMEIIVVGYGTNKRAEFNGSVSVLTPEDITKTPVLRVEQALQGRAAGVVVAQNSGSPGSALSVRIRGTGSLNGSEPLYVVDGIPVGGLDFLNAADIASITVLKDAASTAIYGSRGSNGVVLITTKTGKFDKPGSITYEGYYGTQSAWKKMNLLNAREYAIIQNEAFIASGKVPRPEFANPDALGEGTDWQDAIFGTAPIGSHTITMNGGGSKSNYSLSGGYFTQDGIIGGEKANFERYNARLNAEFKVKEWLTVGNSIGFTNLSRNAIPENNEFSTPLVRALNIDPLTPIKKDDGTYAYSKYADTDIANPVNQIDLTYDTWTTNRVVGSVYGNFKFTENLSFRSSYSVDATFATQDIFLPRFNLSVDPDLRDAPAQEIRDENVVILNHNTWKNYQVENVLSYKKTFAKKHNIGADLGNTILSIRAEFSGGANTNLPSNDPDDAYISNTIDPISAQSSFETAEEESLLSYFGRVNYNFDEKYYLTAIMRADGSSKFGKNNKFGYFPSFSLGWVVTNEDWNMYPVTYMKVRAGWGSNGNNAAPNYAFLSVVNSGQNYAFGPNEIITNGSVPLVIENPDLKWETIEQFNVGTDVELFSGKLFLTTDYFIKKTRDMLFRIPIAATVGATGPTQNVATMVNKGWELAVTHKNRIGSKFSYEVGGNITFIKNEVTSLGLGGLPQGSGNVTFHGGNVALSEVGHPLGSFYGYVTDGIFQNGEEVAAHAFQNAGTAPGDIRFKDLNGDNVIDNDDRTFIGNPNPDFTYGFTASAKYAGLDLSLFIQGTQGNDIYNATVRYDLAFSNRPNSILDRWTGEGTSNSEPRVTLNDPNFNSRASDRFIEDGSYLRLKNIQLGYTLPSELLEKMRMNNLRLYVSSNNLFTFTKYSGFDPEIGGYGGVLEAGIDRGFYPQAKSFIFGLQLTF